MLQGPCRYTDLGHGLPGIATNLLAERLRQLEEAGVVSREAAPPPVATTLFKLTAGGEALLPVLRELGRWGGPLLGDAQPDESFRSYWMALPVRPLLRGSGAGRPTGPDRVAHRRGAAHDPHRGGRIRAHRGGSERPDAVLTGSPKLVVGLLSGHLGLAEARPLGLRVDGDIEVLTRVRTTSATAEG